VKLNLKCVLIAALIVGSATQARADLPRRAMLGVGFGPPAQGETAIARVQTVLPGTTAETMGVKVGDQIVSVGGKPVSTVPEVIAYAGTLRADAPVEVVVQREGQTLKMAGKAIGRPRETYRAADVRYGAVSFRGGQVSDILVTPKAIKDPPVVYLIQGYTCDSIESFGENDPYHRLIQAFVEAGIAVYRVEKPGLGDSLGGVACRQIDYAAELDNFRAAYRRLTGELGFAAERVFMLGHSLGGLEAPMLAAERAPRGVAVYGTVVRNWADYHHDIDTFQDFLMRGVDPVAAEQRAEAAREAFQRFYFQHQSPREIVAAKPALEPYLRESFQWDGGDNVFGRHYKYMQDMAGLPLVQAWRDAKTNVLALYGASDMVALNDEDHRLIATIANFYRPGSGTFIEVADTGHGMELIGSREAVQKQAMSGAQAPPAPFNPKVAEALIGWIRACLAKPPLA
jgi:pimeloyl-ACP methyl ester carboxylesterase